MMVCRASLVMLAIPCKSLVPCFVVLLFNFPSDRVEAKVEPIVEPKLEDLDMEPESPKGRVCECVVCGLRGRLLGLAPEGPGGPLPGLSSSGLDGFALLPASFFTGHAGDGVEAAVDGVGASLLTVPLYVMCDASPPRSLRGLPSLPNFRSPNPRER